MSDWPRSIKPEDRIQYLVNARAEIQGEGIVGELRPENDGVSAYFEDHLVGEFDSIDDAAKALKDYLVVSRAIAQAWEDVAG